jgi:hypothetical protein
MTSGARFVIRDEEPSYDAASAAGVNAADAASADGAVPPRRRPGRLGTRRALLAATSVLAVTGVVTVALALTDQRHPPRPSVSAQAAPLPTGLTTAAPSRSPKPTTPAKKVTPKPTVPPQIKANLPPVQSGLLLATSQPVELSIPAIGVSTSIMNLGLNADSTVQTPPLSRNSVAGWYEFSSTPGSAGSSVLLGHVDSAAYGAGVFFRLGALNPGDEVDVRRQDGIVAVFRIDRVSEFPKSQFPTDQVYGATSYAALRLVTCGGSFDSATGNYRDNIIAFASLVSSRRSQ